MKNILILVAILTISGFSTNAQSKKGDDFILLNNNWNMGRNYYNYGPYGAYKGLPRNIQDHQFSLQYVRSMSKRKALRFSLGYKEHYFYGQSTYQNISDTTFQTYNGYSTQLPKVGIGMEWRKMLHKDVMLIGGGDVALGFSRLQREYSEFKTYQDSNGFRSLGYGTIRSNTGFGMHASLTPFTGLRVGWGRFAIGYTATLPFQFNMAKDGLEGMSEFNINFQHSVSVGYRMYNRKKRKKD